MASLLSCEEDFLMDESSVLAFLADCDMANDAAPVSTLSTPTPVAAAWSDSASSSSPEITTAAEDKKKSWRQRRKEEVLTLREVVKQLSAELERLKMEAGVHSTLPSSERAIAELATSAPRCVLKAQSVHKTEASLMWERIAGRQSTLRQRSEEENAELRKAVALHLQQAKSLQRAIKRKLREDMMSSSMNLIRQHRLNTRGVTPPLNNKAVFEELMAGMDGIYEGVDGFFQQSGMLDLPCPGRKNNTVGVRQRGGFVEFLDSYPLPFDLFETAKAIWTPKADHSDDDKLYFMQNFASGKNTHMRSMCFAFSLEGIDFRIVMRAVTRQYVESDRVVFITRTLIEPIYEFWTATLVETTRLVLTRGGASSVGPTTMMQTHREATLHAGAAALEAIDLQDLPSPDVGLKNWENNITRFNNRVEDQLIRTKC